ncbi:MAG: YhgE/Pip domain-containing protein [Polyangiales bacterium]
MKALFRRWLAAIAAVSHTLRAVFDADIAMYRREPRLAIVTLGVVIVPTLYALIYLSSVWDPMRRTDSLTAAIVDHDLGTTVESRSVNVGHSMVDGIVRSAKVRVQRFATEDEATRAVRDGRAAFALLIDEDFSRRAVRAERPGATIRVYIAEGNSSVAAMFARRFASEVATQTNASLARQRWGAVFARVDESRGGITRLNDAVRALHAGSTQLSDGLRQAHDGSVRLREGAARAHGGSSAIADGSARVAEGTTQLTRGVSRLADGLRTMQARLPSDESMRALAEGSRSIASGSARLSAGSAQLSEGSARLSAGSTQLARGTTQLREGVARIPIWGGRAEQGARRVEAGARSVSDGAAQLSQGARRLSDGAAQLAQGSARLDRAVSQLSEGTVRIHGAVNQMVAAIPDDQRLQTLSDGSSRLAQGNGSLRDGLDRLARGSAQLEHGLVRLHSGSTRLDDGLAQLEAALPREVSRPDGTPESLATSVDTAVTVVAPVVSNGAGFAPYFMPVALWLGAVMTAFVLHLRRVPRSLAGGSRLGLWLGKLAWPSLIVLAQSLSVAASARWGLALPVRHPAAFVLTLALCSLVFIRMVIALQRWFGDAGKGLALLVMVAQLASAGGPYPIELSAKPFQLLHPLMPFTHALKALRAATFDAYDGQWHTHVFKLLASGLLIGLVATVLGRWRAIDDEQYGPAVDLA